MSANIEIEDLYANSDTLQLLLSHVIQINEYIYSLLSMGLISSWLPIFQSISQLYCVLASSAWLISIVTA